MHWKKYGILLPPFLIIAVLLGIYLPIGQKYFATLVVLLFWVFYYAGFLSRRSEEKIIPNPRCSILSSFYGKFHIQYKRSNRPKFNESRLLLFHHTSKWPT